MYDDDDWRNQAVCREHDPEVFFPSPYSRPDQQRAIAICATCPVQVECADAADQLSATDGVWAGVFYDKRGVGYRMSSAR